jgi:hypothetical protein
MTKRFNLQNCDIPSVWCGDKDDYPTSKDGRRYTGIGTRSKCLQKGIGVGIHKEMNKNIAPNDLLNIPYMNSSNVKKFSDQRIYNIDDLYEVTEENDVPQIRKIIIQGCKSSNKVDYKLYNSIIRYLYLHQKNVDLPACKKL